MSRHVRVALALAVLALAGTLACDGSDPTEPATTGTLQGSVLFWEGDFMPGDPPAGTITPVSRELRVHEVTNLSEAVRAPGPYGAFFESVSTPLVATTTSDAAGRFALELPAGPYSLFVVEQPDPVGPSWLYANRLSGLGDIFVVEVVAGEVTSVDFDITYRATF